MKLPVRYFAIGILTASLAFVLSLYFFPSSSANLEDESFENIVAFLEDDGFRVITEDEYISLSVNSSNGQEVSDESVPDEDNIENEENDLDTDDNDSDSGSENEDEVEDGSKENNDNNEEDENNKDKEEKNKQKVVKYTLHVEPNMLAPTVSKLLMKNDIIDDEDAFTKYLEEEGYSKYIQLGKHNLTSDMSFYELAEEITSN